MYTIGWLAGTLRQALAESNMSHELGAVISGSQSDREKSAALMNNLR